MIATLENVKSALKVCGDQLAIAFAQMVVSMVAIYAPVTAKNANWVLGGYTATAIALVEKTAHDVISYQGTV